MSGPSGRDCRQDFAAWIVWKIVGGLAYAWVVPDRGSSWQRTGPVVRWSTPNRSGVLCEVEERRAVKSVAVVGASGAVGDVMIRLLEERKFPVGVDQVPGLRAERGQDDRVSPARRYTIEPLTAEAFAGRRHRPLEHARRRSPAQFSPIAARAGAVVVDNSSAFRMDPDVPLVVPEVNPHDVARHKGIIANPNCSTIQMVVALKPLHDAFRIRRVDRQHLPVGLGSRPEGHARAPVADRGPRRRQGRAPPRRSSPTRSRSTASRRSTTSSRRATPRKR